MLVMIIDMNNEIRFHTHTYTLECYYKFNNCFSVFHSFTFSSLSAARETQCWYATSKFSCYVCRYFMSNRPHVYDFMRKESHFVLEHFSPCGTPAMRGEETWDIFINRI